MYRLQPPDRLRETILLSIRKAEQRRARLYFAISSTTFCASLIGLVFSIQYLSRAFYYSSEFYSYTTLVFSDPDVISRFWQDVAISLAESFPILAVIISLMAIGALLSSIRIMVNNVTATFTLSYKT